VEKAAAEVQKGNPLEERKIQRLFRNPEAARLIKRCNDFGAGGVAVAVGEMAEGLIINLDRVPKKYAGLSGLELAISESQERMAVLTAASDAAAFIALAGEENLEAVVIAEVSGEKRLRMFWRGECIVDLSREFLDSQGAPRSASALLGGALLASGDAAVHGQGGPVGAADLLGGLEEELGSLRSGSRRGLQERFDGSIGALSVLFPFGGAAQGTPECGMAALIPSVGKRSRTASILTYGYDPDVLAASPYRGAKGSIREALAKFACLGGDPFQARLSLQEYFGRTGDERSWGLPASALLGALEAQIRLGVPAIGGKDSMSGSYRDPSRGIALSVPPSLAAFAAGTVPAARIRSGALSGRAGNPVVLLDAGAEGDEWALFRANMEALSALGRFVRAAYPVGAGGLGAALALMAFGNMTGLEVSGSVWRAFPAGGGYQGSVLAELELQSGAEWAEAEGILAAAGGRVAATTLSEPVFRVLPPAADTGGGAAAENAEAPLEKLRRIWEDALAAVYPQSPLSTVESEGAQRQTFFLKNYQSPQHHHPAPSARHASPLVVLPVFPGTNCEWDMERSFREAGAATRLVIFRNRGPAEVEESIAELSRAIAGAQILALSGGFSAGDEPDGSGKFIAAVLRAPQVADALTALVGARDGLVLGICNGFQALIKLGLLPYGEYRDAGPGMPTLALNRLGRHVSRMVHTRVQSVLSPWLRFEEPGAIHVLPVSHGEGRVVLGDDEAEALYRGGQVPFCYTDALGRPALSEPDNPNGSAYAIEGLTSPDGRILGKMGHSERRGAQVHINIPGNKYQTIFEAGVAYFTPPIGGFRGR
jgi:phosphoribosylformylglycinamidine synthase